MKPKSLKIGNVVTENNIFLAPLAGFSDFAMRNICLSYGAGLTFTEMISCKGLLYDNERTVDLLYTTPSEKIKCVQIFGNDASVMRKAVESEHLAKFDIIDVNFGCPMPKIYQNGEGSAILENPSLAEKIIYELKKTGKTVTCKFRIGIHEGQYLTSDFAKAVENGGADMITVHGRVRDKIYAGEVNYSEIEKAKKTVKIPVIANGGIFSKEDADKMIERTGADGIMIARGALEKPWIFAELLNKKVSVDKKQLIRRHIELLKTFYDDKYVAISFRKQLCLYLKGEKNCTEFKQKLFTLTDTESILTEVDNFFNSQNLR